MEQWQAQDTDSTQQDGLLLDNTVDVGGLGRQLAGLRLIVLQFPKWTDGRAYTQAAMLRRRVGFRGEIRAVGEVLVDMAPLLARNGFDTAVLRADQDPQAAYRALQFFDLADTPGAYSYYQGDVFEARPLFARTAA
ncbi:MAG: DUF934 domain-containing protein [Betaproteobacteria bacterium]|nr:DUF934 domain-containing protein [Betaproteobacteria bacterium]